VSKLHANGGLIGEAIIQRRNYSEFNKTIELKLRLNLARET
jgi:hypothetical protein